MRRSIVVLVNTILLIACVGLADAHDGYVGIYADSNGTAPCVTIPPLQARLLYVLAKLDGTSANGITGAEFRIEVENPDGWMFSYYPPPAQILVGNPVDLDPADPDDGSGLSIALASCLPPANGIVSLGTLLAFNMSGDATRLSIKRHSTPTNAYYPCPLFTLCDAPEYTSVCMGEGTAPACSVLSPSKTLIPDDPEIFALIVNDENPPQPQSNPFTDQLTVGASVLWVSGERVAGGDVRVDFDAAALHFDERLVVDFGAAAERTPTARSLQLIELHHRVRAAYRARGAEGAVQEAESFASVEAVQLRPEGVLARISDLNAWMSIPLHSQRQRDSAARHRVTVETKARNLVNDIRMHIEAVPQSGLLVMVSRSGRVRYLGGEKRVSAEAQLAHVAAGLPVSTMPTGPIARNDRMIDEIIAAREGN